MLKSRKIHTKFLILLHFYHQPSVLSFSLWTRYADYCSGCNIKQITRFLCGRPIIRQIRLVAGVLFLLWLYFVYNVPYKSSYNVMALLVLHLWECLSISFFIILLNVIKINEEWKEKQILNTKKKKNYTWKYDSIRIQILQTSESTTFFLNWFNNAICGLKFIFL